MRQKVLSRSRYAPAQEATTGSAVGTDLSGYGDIGLGGLKEGRKVSEIERELAIVVLRVALDPPDRRIGHLSDDRSF